MRDVGGRVTGVVGHHDDGRPLHVDARVVVGADGWRSRVARDAGAPAYDEREATNAIHYAYWSGLDDRGVELWYRSAGGVMAGVFPTNGGACVWVNCRADRCAELRRDLGANYLRFVGESAPGLVERLVLVNSYADRFRDDIPRLAADTRAAWGTGGAFARLAPSWRDREVLRFLARYERQSATPDTAAHLIALCDDIDVRSLLPAISPPTRIVHRRDDTMFPLAKGRALAEGIPGADLVVVEGRDHLVYVDQEPILDAVEQFLTVSAPAAEPDRVLTTVLFANAGEPATPGSPLADLARDDLARFRGDPVPTTGQGLVATFDGPARAVRCGHALLRTAAHLGPPLRIGVHTTEVERLGHDIAGLGVHIGAQVAATATPGEVWATRTVRDLVAGSGLRLTPAAPTASTGSTNPGRSTRPAPPARRPRRRSHPGPTGARPDRPPGQDLPVYRATMAACMRRMPRSHRSRSPARRCS